jgi:hypothetical protein
MSEPSRLDAISRPDEQPAITRSESAGDRALGREVLLLNAAAHGARAVALGQLIDDIFQHRHQVHSSLTNGPALGRINTDVDHAS